MVGEDYLIELGQFEMKADHRNDFLPHCLNVAISTKFGEIINIIFSASKNSNLRIEEYEPGNLLESKTLSLKSGEKYNLSFRITHASSYRLAILISSKEMTYNMRIFKTENIEKSDENDSETDQEKEIDEIKQPDIIMTIHIMLGLLIFIFVVILIFMILTICKCIKK